ncbi:MAG: hypothetical protein AB1898_04575 [Acidobacteriota bacterium]
MPRDNLPTWVGVLDVTVALLLAGVRIAMEIAGRGLVDANSLQRRAGDAARCDTRDNWFDRSSP